MQGQCWKLINLWEEYWRNICKPSLWRNKLMVDYSFRTHKVKVGFSNLPIFQKSLIDSQYLVSSRQSMEFMVGIHTYQHDCGLYISLLSHFQQPPYHVFFNQSDLTSNSARSFIPNLMWTNMSKRTNATASDSGKRESSSGIMKNKNKQTLELSDEEKV